MERSQRKKTPPKAARAVTPTDKAAEPKRGRPRTRPEDEAPAGASAQAEGGSQSGESSAETDTPEVGTSLRQARAARGMSLEALARTSGVSRAMLSQIELGHSTPTIKVLWKVARALGVPFSALISDEKTQTGATVLRADRARRLTSHDGKFSSRALFPADRPRRVEFYELRLAPGGHEEAEPHPSGTLENLVVHRGNVEIRVSGGGGGSYKLGVGDAILFQADVPHVYRNDGGVEAVMYLVMSYPEAVTSPGWSV